MVNILLLWRVLFKVLNFPRATRDEKLAFASVGIKAKNFGKEAKNKFVWWKGKKIIYRSQEHINLIEKAIRAKFVQNPTAMKALLATKGMKLTHNLGPESPTTSLPAQIFISIPTKNQLKFLLVFSQRYVRKT